MFQLVYDLFGDEVGVLRIFNYVTFRALMAGLTSMFLSFFLGNLIIGYLYKLKFKENIREDGPKSHSVKSGTPTMGGIMIVFTMLISLIFWANWKNYNLILLTVFSLAFALLGFTDDYLKAIKKVKGGMRARTKFLISLVLACAFSYIFYFHTGKIVKDGKGIQFVLTDIFLPFIKGPILDLGFFAIPFSALIVISSSHAVNLTDGLDGLAAGTACVVTVTLGILAYLTGTPIVANYLNLPYLVGAHEYSVFLSALSGSLLGFLWFNFYPAQVFMGDTGSLFLGSTIGMISIMIKKELLLPILGAVFVIEALSVILQVGSFKLTQKRIFKMAPIHHHFELLGWKETKIVFRFYVIAIILAMISLSTLKIQ